MSQYSPHSMQTNCVDNANRNLHLLTSGSMHAEGLQGTIPLLIWC